MKGALGVLRANLADGATHATVHAASNLGGPTGQKSERDMHAWCKSLYGFDFEIDTVEVTLPGTFSMEQLQLHVLPPQWVLRCPGLSCQKHATPPSS